MPSVDPSCNSGSGSGGMYPPSPSRSGPPLPPNGRNTADSSSPERGLPPMSMPQVIQGGMYGYVPPPGGYGPPPHPYHPMAPQQQQPPPGGDIKSGPHQQPHLLYGQYGPPSTQYQQHQHQYSSYGGAGGYMAYAYGGGGGGRPWMSPYESGGAPPPPQGYSYPSQHSMRGVVGAPPPTTTTNEPSLQPRGRSTRGGHTSTPYSMQVPEHERQLQQHGMKEEDNVALDMSQEQRQPLSASPPGGDGAQRQPHTPRRHKNSVATAEDLERMKAAAAAEQSLAEVKPIQTDFHFFVRDRREKLLAAAEAEVDKSLKGQSPELITKHRTHLINSNLNCRLLKAWEDLPRDEREEYFKKEEDDRQRFMEEDEVAGRHCFTLTARIKSPSKKGPLVAPEDEDEGFSGSPLEFCAKEEDEVVSSSDEEKQGKRSSHDVPSKEESPTKKNKAEDDTASQDRE